MIGRNIFSLGLSRIISGVILFAVQAKLASYLGPDGFGKYSLVMAFYAIFFLFIDFGISRYFIKKVGEDGGQTPLYLGNFFIAQFFSSLVIFALFLILPKIFGYEADVARAMIIAAVGLLLASMSIPFTALVQAAQRIHILAVIYFVDTILKAAWFTFAILSHKDIEFLFWILVVVGASDLVVFAIATRLIARPKIQAHRQILREMILYGISFAMLVGFETLIAKADVVIQKHFLDYDAVGLYSAAYRFLDFLTFLPAVVAISLFPYFSAQKDIDSSDNRDMSEKIHRFLLAVAVPLGVGSTVLASNIILTSFGPGYEGAILPFRILIWSTVITLFYGVANVVMQVKALKTAIFILLSSTLFNIAGNIVLIPRYGIMASAWLTVLSYILVAVLYLIHSRRYLRFPLWRPMLRPVMSSAVMGFVIWQIREWNLFLLIGIAMVIYFSILFAAGFLKK
ncbi:MAG: hypothetical protein A2751_05185 [Candidatus Doudnabacteria bacterium RIFCSPHIGHO2_01_FULL_46_14]|uniref:Uncharacterized protein n=1 Tax=Candidatus Doudnabacteria bacterium RIFCSPHIGHO2_01_FULL_46_14 TaxID=1817824 RepID=A0A1F5NNY6_9BACT|nr:MAG: hypothetical protein A2751_05185 [Candidatus Doudnabacteria bacterium RIFCSPHIGHO2_01_FULL_46_14]